MDSFTEELVVSAVRALDRAESSVTARQQVRDYLVRQGWTPPKDRMTTPYPDDARASSLTSRSR